jgi:hypothetical protein
VVIGSRQRSPDTASGNDDDELNAGISAAPIFDPSLPRQQHEIPPSPFGNWRAGGMWSAGRVDHVTAKPCADLSRGPSLLGDQQGGPVSKQSTASRTVFDEKNGTSRDRGAMQNARPRLGAKMSQPTV